MLTPVSEPLPLNPPGSASELKPVYLSMLAISRETSTPASAVFFQPASVEFIGCLGLVGDVLGDLIAALRIGAEGHWSAFGLRRFRQRPDVVV